MGDWIPELTLVEANGRCRLSLSGLTYGHGSSLQEAADDLIARVVRLAIGLTRGPAAPFSSELPPPDVRVVGFLHDVATLADRRETLRELVLRGVPVR